MRFVLILVATCGLVLASAPAAIAADGKLDGRITVRGKPFIGKIAFHLDDQFVGSKVNDEGKYKVNRLMVGKYKVTVEGKGVPEKYTSDDLTPLTVDVQEGDNTFNFELQ
jgi:hypothetical protein